MKTSYVLIDFENVQPRNMAFLSGGAYKIRVFLGANQSNVPLEMAQALQSLGNNAEYVRITGNGSNALDFHIAYYLGRLSLENPNVEFHIVSRDKGFDPLIAHLNSCGVQCARHTSLDAFAPVKKPAAPAPPPEKLKTVVEYLIRRKEAKPRTVRSLQSAVKSLFGGKLAEPDLKALVEELSKRGVVKVCEGRVTYDLPDLPEKTDR